MNYLSKTIIYCFFIIRWLYVSLSFIICIALAGGLSALLIPRSVDVVQDNVTTLYVDLNVTRNRCFMTLQVSFFSDFKKGFENSLSGLVLHVAHRVHGLCCPGCDLGTTSKFSNKSALCKIKTALPSHRCNYRRALF